MDFSVILFIFLNLTLWSFQVQSTSIFTASIFSGSNILDTSKIQTAGQYISLHQIVRPFTQLDKQAQITANAMKSWKVSNDGTIFDFKMADNLLWSDGTPITVEEVVKSINRQIEIKTANHFDFSTIKSISILNSKELRIELKNKNNNFIRQISYPEFGIVMVKEDLSIDFSKVSGAYNLIESNNDHFILQKNKHFPYHTTSSPEIVRIEWGDSKDKQSKAQKNHLDFFVPFADFNKKTLNDITTDGEYKQVTPHIGYSFWLSLNPRSEKLSNINTRKQVQALIKRTKFDFDESYPFWIPANQIYLPDGLGRPNRNEVENIWDDIVSLNNPLPSGLKLTLLMDSSFPFAQKIIDQLNSHNIETTVDWFSPKDNFFEALNKKAYDIIQVRNDFSSIDLHENLQTTFNEKNALIITSEDDNQFKNELQNALSLETLEKRSDVYKDIALKIIQKGYVVPIAYHQVLFVHKKKYDISSWSKLFPEISLWKIKLN